MHRSGTSAVTAALSLGGAWPGASEDLTDALPENPAGFWERRDVRGICDRLLESAGASWWKVAGFDARAIPHVVRQEEARLFRAVVQHLDAHGTAWVIKEPRLCLLFPVVQHLLADPLCVHVYRNPLEVAYSLRSRNGIGVAEGLALWERYTASSLSASHGHRRVLVSYEELIASPEPVLQKLLNELAALGVRDLAMPDARALTRLLRADLKRQRVNRAEAEEFLTAQQQELWQHLRSGSALDIAGPITVSAVSTLHLRDLESRLSTVDHFTAKLASRGRELSQLKAQLERTRSDVERATREAERSTKRISELEKRVRTMETSTSWRLTAPVRLIGRLAKRLRRYVR